MFLELELQGTMSREFALELGAKTLSLRLHLSACLPLYMITSSGFESDSVVSA